MSDQTGKKRPADDSVEEAEVVTEVVVVEEAEVVEDDAASADTVIEAEPVSEDAATTPVATETAPAREVIYVTTPAAPRKLGNRGLGSVLAIAGAVVFTVLLAVAAAVFGLIFGQGFRFDFLTEPQFYVPALFFVIGFVLVVLVVNRAPWWAHVIASLVVALIVYFGSIGFYLLTSGIVQNTPAEAAERFGDQLLNPFVIIAALLAREVALWTGAILSRRGQKLRVRNSEARENWQREVAEARAEGQRRATEASRGL